MPESEILPSNLEAERALLGAVVAWGDKFRVLSDLIDVTDFHLEAHRRIWLAMEHVTQVGGRIEPASLTAYLAEQGQLESVGGTQRLLHLDDGIGSTFGGEHYARIVRECSVKRRAVLACRRLENELMLGGDSTELLTQAEAVLRDLNTANCQQRRLRTAAEIISERGGLSAFLARSAEPGIPTRFGMLNRIVGGLKPGQLWIIAARPSVGKTSFATELLEHAARTGACGAMFSLEMPSDDLILRMCCSRGRVDWTRYREGSLTSDERRRLSAANAEVAELPIVFDDTASCTVAGIHAAIARHNATQPVALVVVDYLQLMEATGRHENRTQAITTITRGLKLAAKQFRIPFVVLSQLTRGPEHEKRRPTLSDLRDSGSIEQDADVVIFLHPTEEGYGPTRQIKLIVAKQRNGPIAELSMVFLRSYARFEEAAPAEDAEA